MQQDFFEIVEDLGTITDLPKVNTKLSRIKFPSGRYAVMLSKTTDTERGPKMSRIILSEDAAFSLSQALANYFL